MRERDLQAKCIDYCKENGIVHINVHQSGWTARGFPDLVLCIRGKFIACELKVDKNNLEPAQRIWKTRILKAGGKHYTPRSVKEFEEIIRSENDT